MDKCKHGFDHACLICGFTHIDGKKVWFDWAWQEQQKRIDIATEALDTKEFLNEKLRKEVKEQQKRIDEQAKEINFLNNKADDLALDQMKTAQFNYQLEQKIDELQARVDAALKETQHASRYVEEDMRGNHEFLQMAMIRTFKSLAQALKGGEV